VAFVGWFLVFAGGCAAVTGLDSISEQDCAPLCGDAQAAKDVTIDVPAQDSTSPDTSMAVETGGAEAGDDGPALPETSTPVDASEAGAKESGTDAPSDSPAEVGPDAPFSDAPFDSGCGNLNTTSNCSACGDKCASTSTSVTSVSCSGSTNGVGATCQYTCATGYLDCDMATNPPDLNGCECHAPGATQAQCCATSGGDCPIQHKNGLGQSTSLFWDCVPAGTMNSLLAQDACIAYVGAAKASQCQPYLSFDDDSGVPDSYCSGGTATGDCICWAYSGQYAGTVCDAKAIGAPDPTQCYGFPTSGTFN
jgi:hypothetical protein